MQNLSVETLNLNWTEPLQDILIETILGGKIIVGLKTMSRFFHLKNNTARKKEHIGQVSLMCSYHFSLW